MIDERSKALEDAISRSSLAFYEGLVKAIENGSTELAALIEFVEQHYASASADDRLTFLRTAAAIEECQNLALRMLKQKGGGQAEPPDMNNGIDTNDANVAAGSIVSGGSSGRDVVLLLERALGYLRAHERHNPAAFLVEDAIRWTKMPIATWYLEANEDTSMSGFISKLMRQSGSGGSS